MLLGRNLGPRSEEQRRLTKLAPGIYAALGIKPLSDEEAIKRFFDPSPICEPLTETQK
jgi:hypothetical protein